MKTLRQSVVEAYSSITASRRPSSRRNVSSWYTSSCTPEANSSAPTAMR
jgi:hypothetical protein